LVLVPFELDLHAMAYAARAKAHATIPDVPQLWIQGHQRDYGWGWTFRYIFAPAHSVWLKRSLWRGLETQEHLFLDTGRSRDDVFLSLGSTLHSEDLPHGQERYDVLE
jgi:hypothetical protein